MVGLSERGTVSNQPFRSKRQRTLLRHIADIDIERYLMCQEVEQVHVEVEYLRQLLQEKAARRMPQAVLNIVQMRPGNPAPFFGLD